MARTKPSSKAETRKRVAPLPPVRFTLVIPVRNGGELLLRSVRSVMNQNHKPAEILIFDTESTDGAVSQIKTLTGKIPLKVFPVRKNEFDHGGTRNAALKAARMPWVLFMTQDAVCAKADSVEELLRHTTDAKIAAVYGRQLPHDNANPLAATARTANYGENLIRQNLALAEQLGIKTWFTSNSFCLWNRRLLLQNGGFAEKLILGEDMHAAARLIQSGLTVIYEPRALVQHSHNYTAREEFQRYFDIGVFHAVHQNLLFRAGNANKEGLKFVLRQAADLWRARALFSLLRFPFHIMAKFLGYKAGRKYTLLGNRLSRFLSMHKAYWNR